MRIFRPKYRDRNGKKKQVNKWWVEIKDHNEIVRRFAGERDKAATETIGRNIEKLISLWHANEPPSTQLVLWLNQAPAKLRERLVKIGLLDSGWVTASKSILEHVRDFENSLALRGKEKHARQTASMLRKIIGG